MNNNNELGLNDFKDNQNVQKAFDNNLQKAKYTKRLGTPGNYRYIYSNNDPKRSKTFPHKTNEGQMKELEGNVKREAKKFIKQKFSIDEKDKAIEALKAHFPSLREDAYKFVNSILMQKEAEGNNSETKVYQQSIAEVEDAYGDTYKVGSSVTIHPSLTTDPLDMQGEKGKVVKIEADTDTVHIKFKDGQVGKYSANGVVVN